MVEEYGNIEWRGRLKGRYWLAKEFHTWPEIRAVGLAELGVFVQCGIWAADYPGTEISRETSGYMRGQCSVRQLVDRGLWLPAGPKTYQTKTMSELRIGRGDRGVILRLSRRLFMGPESCRCGMSAFGVYALAASWSMTTSRPGYIPTEVATQFGKQKHLAALWDCGLWRVSEHGFWMNNGGYPADALWAVTRDDRRAEIPPEVRKRVLDRCGNVCVRCGSTDELALDHIYPWSLGGPDDEDNLQVLCTPCNSAKGAKVLEKGAAW